MELMMNNLKELTQAKHTEAEQTPFVKLLLRGLSPKNYYLYLHNQYAIYSTLESLTDLTGIENIKRTDLIRQDIKDLEHLYSFKDPGDVTLSSVKEYINYISTLPQKQLMAHVYVRHFGDMYGGQIIKKNNPSLGKMYKFENAEELKTKVRAMLSDDMADEANTCFDHVIKFFDEMYTTMGNQ
jgi:heme oxygenase